MSAGGSQGSDRNLSFKKQEILLQLLEIIPNLSGEKHHKIFKCWSLISITHQVQSQGSACWGKPCVCKVLAIMEKKNKLQDILAQGGAGIFCRCCWYGGIT